MAVLNFSKFLVCAIFNDLAPVDDDNAVALLDGRHAVGNDHTRAAFHCAVQRLLHDFLTLLVQSTCGFVQYHNLRVLDQGSGNGDSLLLASRKLAAFETAQLFKAGVERVLKSPVERHVDEAVKASCVVALNPGSVLLQKAAEVRQVLRRRHCCAESLHRLQVELALVHLEAGLDLSLVLLSQHLRR